MKQSYYEVGPNATKLLAKKLWKKLILQSVYKIEDPQTKQVCNNLDEIDEAFQKYDSSLYSQPQLESKKNIKALLDSLDLPTIGAHQNECINSPISKKELENALQKLENNKPPGSNCLPADWYKVFREDLIPVLLRTFNWSLQKMSTPPSPMKSSLLLYYCY